MAFTYNIQSVVHGKIHQHSTLYLSKQCSVNTFWVSYTTAACFPFQPLEKCKTKQGYFSRTLSFNLKRTFQEAWEPCHQLSTTTNASSRVTKITSFGTMMMITYFIKKNKKTQIISLLYLAVDKTELTSFPKTLSVIGVDKLKK